MAISEEINAEALAFSKRMEERIRHGHVPDLRRVQPCDWFYNNPWRRPYLVDMDCGQAFRFAVKHARKEQLLDVGCGPGHMSLEFGRNGFHVTGLDISPGCLEVARQVLADNPFSEGFGNVRYVNEDFLTWEAPIQSVDTICFFGTLHHFESPDQTLDRAAELLRPGGRMLVLEPARDWISESNGAVMSLVRLLLGIQNLWFQPLPLPTTEAQLRDHIHECLTELKEGIDKDEPKQSPHDNACGAEAMLVSLRARFEEVECQERSGILQRVMGGIRGRTEEESRRLVEFLGLFDSVAIKIGLIQPGEFYWAGQKT